jgi:hypothetical protein
MANTSTEALPALDLNIVELDWVNNGVSYDDFAIGENGTAVFTLDGFQLYTSHLNDNIFKIHFIEADSTFPEDYARFRGKSAIAVDTEAQKIIPLS